MQEEKVVGILGGMGPEATVDLMGRVIAKTDAGDDCDHIRMIVDNNPKVPSRMKAILGGDGEDPGVVMADMARRLEAWGADFLVIPCNTAHHYHGVTAAAVSIPVVHLPDLVVETVRTRHPGVKRVGVLASTAVLKIKLYERRFAAKGVEVMYPDPERQEALLKLICEVKAGDTGSGIRERFRDLCRHVRQKGAEIGILACTELGVIAEDLPIVFVDAADVLASEIVDVAQRGKGPCEAIFPEKTA